MNRACVSLIAIAFASPALAQQDPLAPLPVPQPAQQTPEQPAPQPMQPPVQVAPSPPAIIGTSGVDLHLEPSGDHHSSRAHARSPPSGGTQGLARRV